MERWVFHDEKLGTQGSALLCDRYDSGRILFAVTVFQEDPVLWFRRIARLPEAEEAVAQLLALIEEHGDESLREEAKKVAKKFSEALWENRAS